MNPKQLLHEHHISPKRSLGQNFLFDAGVLEQIVAAAAPEPGDIVLEVGAGTGSLTRPLAQAAGQVIAVEIDDRLIPLLHAATAGLPNVTVVHGDILAVDVGALVGAEAFHVVGNLPYYITSAVLRRLLEADTSPRPQRLTLTVQYEVAQRLRAEPGAMSLLAVSVQFYGTVQMVRRLKAGTFWPTPGVDSAVVRIDTYETPPLPVDERLFFRVVKAGFSQKRKQLKNALSGGLGLKGVASIIQSAGIDPRRRAETLSLAEWGALTGALTPYL